MIQVLTRAPAGSPEWHAARRGKIGGTAAANIICGGDPSLRTFGTPLSEWERLTGRPTRVSDEENELLEYGRRIEPMHRQWLADLLGATVEDAPGVIQHPNVPFIAVSPDGALILPNERLELEMKSAVYTIDEWDEGSPLPPKVQLATVMSAVGGEAGIVSVQIAGRKPRYTRIERNREFESYMLDTLGHFMDYHVAKDIAPPATGRDADKEVLHRLFTKTNGATVDLDIALASKITRLVDVRELKSALKKEEDALKNELHQALGEASTGRAGTALVTCAWQGRAGYTVKPTEFPVIKAFKG